MNRALIFLVLVACIACGPKPTERTIRYRADVPIKERLEPGDTKVVVEMKMADAPTTTVRESFEQEIRRLRRADIIAVVRISSTQSEIADNGTWVRTRVTAAVERAVRAPAQRPLDESVEFSYGGGRTQLGNVEVSTGKFPQFVEGSQYLMFLSVRRGTSALAWNGFAYRIDDAGTLQRVGISDGSEQQLPTTLVGRNASEVADALAR